MLAANFLFAVVLKKASINHSFMTSSKVFFCCLLLCQWSMQEGLFIFFHILKLRKFHVPMSCRFLTIMGVTDWMRT